MNLQRIKSFLKPIQRTPLHPQWFILKENEKICRDIGSEAKGRVLDIGCANQYIEKFLPSCVTYIGLDYYQTATEWYHSAPDVFGDAQKLPFTDESVDTVLLLDVLEHLPDPRASLQEIVRVLRSDGVLVLQVPFVYPLHDVPLDYQRWTHIGLRRILSDHGFVVKKETVQGSTLETCGLLMNIGLCKVFMLWLKRKSPWIFIGLLTIPMVPVINLTCWILSKISPADTFMPHGYRFVATKKKCDTLS